MTLDETILEEARPWGSKAHLEWRKSERLAGRMNQWIQRGRRKQKVAAPEKQSHGIESAVTMTPIHGDKAKKGYGTPRKRWSERCMLCAGSKTIISLKGERIQCPRCKDL